MTDTEIKAKLMRRIYATSNKLGWDYSKLHEMMIVWKFGQDPHLTKMSLFQMREVIAHLIKCSRPASYQFDEQGKYMFHLVQIIGWDMKRLNRFLVKKYHKTHWNLLTSSERRGVINMLTRYEEQGKRETGKRKQEKGKTEKRKKGNQDHSGDSRSVRTKSQDNHRNRLRGRNEK